MKRSCVAFFLAMTVLASVCVPANATLFFADGFDYPDGDLTVFGGSGDNVSGGLWAPHSGTGNPIPIAVLNGEAVLAQGNPASEDAFRTAGQTIALGETWYFSSLLKVVDTRNGNGLALDQDSYFMHFKDNTSGGFRARTYVDDPSTGVGGPGFSFGLSASSGNAVVNTTDLNFGQTYTIVGSYAVDTGEVRLWVDPTDSSSPSISHTLAAAAFNPVEALAIRQDFVTAGNTFTVYADAVALGSDFASVLAAVTPDGTVPEPSSIVLILASVVGLTCGSRRKFA